MRYDQFTNSTERRRLCTCGKVAFSKKDAQTKRNALIKHGNGRDFRLYQCHLSDYWHLTSRMEDYFPPKGAWKRRRA